MDLKYNIGKYSLMKGKVHPRIGHEGHLGLDWVGGERHASAALTPEKCRFPLYNRLHGPQGRSGGLRKIAPHTGFRSPDRPARSESLYRLNILILAVMFILLNCDISVQVDVTTECFIKYIILYNENSFSSLFELRIYI
jgi:hypothetical protein